MDILFSHVVYWTWWIIGLVLVIVEVFVSGAFFLWLGLSAAAVGVVIYFIPDLDWKFQLMIFSVLSISSILLFRRLFQRSAEEKSTLSRRGTRYIGDIVVVEEAIKNGIGRVRVDDTLWRVKGPDSDTGDLVKIVAIEGSTFRVEKES